MQRALVIPPSRPIPHIFSVDVEEHFQVSAFERYIDRRRWSALPSRVVANTNALLELLARHDVRGTFFILGWVARRNPELVRRIAGGGHEVASHGSAHDRVTTLRPAEFRGDVRDARSLLEEITGERVIGYRAPSFSIVPGREWALEILVEEGYAYDSSLFPVQRRGYGYSGTPMHPHWMKLQAGRLAEFPPATVRWGPMSVPAAGGGYFRQFPYGVTAMAFRQHAALGHPGMFYIHPWEIDPEQPRVAAPLLTRVRHYRGLSQTMARLERLLTDFPFQPARDYFNDTMLAAPASSLTWR